MSLSPVSSRYIVFLLALLYLQAHTVDASISTSADFPQDVFAKPAFQVKYGSIGKDAVTLPIKRMHAMSILHQQEESSSSMSNTSFSPTSKDLAHLFSSLEKAGVSEPSSASLHGAQPRTFLWSLQRASPDDFQLCSIPDFTFTPADKHTPSYQRSASAGSPRTKQDLIRNAQRLLEPLKKVCLYHTSEWFTYSFCHGREIRQFRRLGPQAAAQKAFKAAGGGDAGKKAALEAAEKVSSLQHPVDDPAYPAFTLGRWTSQSEEIIGDDHGYQRQQQQHRSDAVQSSTGVSVSSGVPSLINTAGLDLVEEVQFGDWDEEELFAAEAKALEHFKEYQNSAVEPGHDISNVGGHDPRRHRYLTQRWTNGTMCDMNHQPRTVEVQFHCSNAQPREDRIVIFKETTICNYVLVIETPRLCEDPAFGSEKEEAPLPIHCHRVVEDNYPGPTLGDPERAAQPQLSEIADQRSVSSQDANTQQSDTDRTPSPGQVGATTSTEPGVEGAATTSHTYGDLSRYGSVHDDYFDETLGGHGALYQEYQHDHDHDQNHDHDDAFHQHGQELGEAEVVVEIGIDENGQLLVNQVIEPPAEPRSTPAERPSPMEGKETRRRENGKKRNDDDSGDDTANLPMEIQLTIDDLLSVLRGDQRGSMKKKLTEQISDLLSKQQLQQQQQQQQRDTSAALDKAGSGKKEEPQTPEEVAKLYKRFMSAITGERTGKKASSEEAKGAIKGKAQGKGKQPPALRMEKVGDSLSERVKRFYEAKERESKAQGERKKRGSTPPAPLAEQLEL